MLQLRDISLDSVFGRATVKLTVYVVVVTVSAAVTTTVELQGRDTASVITVVAQV